MTSAVSALQQSRQGVAADRSMAGDIRLPGRRRDGPPNMTAQQLRGPARPPVAIAEFS